MTFALVDRISSPSCSGLSIQLTLQAMPAASEPSITTNSSGMFGSRNSTVSSARRPSEWNRLAAWFGRLLQLPIASR